MFSRRGRSAQGTDVTQTSPLHVQSTKQAEAMAPWLAVRIVLGAGLGMYINLGPVLLYTFGVFLKPIAADTGWDRTLISGAFGPAMFLVGLTAPLVGQKLDRYGPRRFVAVSALLFAAGLFVLGLAPHSAGGFAACLVLAMVLGSGLTPLPFSHVISSWFDARRGLALGLALSISGIAVATVPPLAATLIAHFGWRLSYVLLGAMVLLIGLSTSRWLLEDPAAVVAGESAPPPISEGLTLREALRTRTFWLLAFGLLFISTAVAAGTVHLPALLGDRGVPPTRAAFIMSVVGASMIVGRIAIGALIDRAFAPHVSALVFLAPLVGHALLTGSGAGLNAIVAAAMFGLGLGAELDVFPYMTSRAFGVRHFGQVYGAMLVAFTSGLALGAAIVGALYGRFGQYDQALWIAGAFAVVSAASMLFLRRADFPFRARAH